VAVDLAVEAVAVVRALPRTLPRAELTCAQALVRPIRHDGMRVSGAAAFGRDGLLDGICLRDAGGCRATNDECESSESAGDASPNARQCESS
jgi:hypothetical protein